MIVLQRCSVSKRKKGSKVHAAVDTLGHLLALHVSPASEQDRAQVEELAVQDATGETVELAYVEQGYTGRSRPRQRRSTAFGWRWSSGRRPSEASRYCRGSGWWSAISRGRRAFGGWPRDTSGCLPR
jgi:hypothetical protein